jgi:GNAT superfamily N-acetyltransferase
LQAATQIPSNRGVPAFIFRDPPTLEEVLSKPGPRIHEVTLEDFLGSATTPEQTRQNPRCEAILRSEASLTQISRDLVREMHAEFLAGDTEYVELRRVRDDCRFVLLDKPRHILILSPDLQTVYGGTGMMLVVFPEYQGRGIGTALHLAIDEYQDSLTGPVSYSESGYACRLSAHRQAVIRAHDEGMDDIHPENLERYAEHLPRAHAMSFT